MQTRTYVIDQCIEANGWRFSTAADKLTIKKKKIYYRCLFFKFFFFFLVYILIHRISPSKLIFEHYTATMFSPENLRKKKKKTNNNIFIIAHHIDEESTLRLWLVSGIAILKWIIYLLWVQYHVFLFIFLCS